MLVHILFTPSQPLSFSVSIVAANPYISSAMEPPSQAPLDTNSPASHPLTPSDWVLYASLNEELISKEIRLISDRTGWLNTTQSFLFGAFCLIAVSSNNNTVTAQRLMLLIPLLGLTTLAACFFGVVAARIVILELELQRAEFQEKLNDLFGTTHQLIGPERQGRLRASRKLGGLPFNAISSVLLVLWLVILANRVQITFLPGYN